MVWVHKYQIFLFTQAGLVQDKIDLVDIAVRNWVPMGYLYSKILPTKSHTLHHSPAARSPPRQGEHWNFATGNYTSQILQQKITLPADKF